MCAGVGEHRPVYDALHVSALRWPGLDHHHTLCDVPRNRPHQTEKEPQGAGTCRCVHFLTSRLHVVISNDLELSQSKIDI